MNSRHRSFVIHTFGSLTAAASGCKPPESHDATPVLASHDAALDAALAPLDAISPAVGQGTSGDDAATLGRGIFAALGAGDGGESNGWGYGGGGRMGHLGGRRSADYAPLVRALPPSVTGMLSPEAIRRVVLRNLGQITHCHEQALARNPNIEGRVVIRFTIDARGVVSAANVAESSYPDATATACMTHAVTRWQFPEPQDHGSVTVNYPFNMSHST